MTDPPPTMTPKPSNVGPFGAFSSNTILTQNINLCQRAFDQWKNLITCQCCHETFSSISEIYLLDDVKNNNRQEGRLCSTCLLVSDTTNTKERRSLFRHINGPSIDVHDSSANDPGRIVWILQQLLQAYERQRMEQEGDDVEEEHEEETEVDNDMLENQKPKTALHDEDSSIPINAGTSVPLSKKMTQDHDMSVADQSLEILQDNDDREDCCYDNPLEENVRDNSYHNGRALQNIIPGRLFSENSGNIPIPTGMTTTTMTPTHYNSLRQKESLIRSKMSQKDDVLATTTDDPSTEGRMKKRQRPFKKESQSSSCSDVLMTTLVSPPIRRTSVGPSFESSTTSSKCVRRLTSNGSLHHDLLLLPPSNRNKSVTSNSLSQSTQSGDESNLQFSIPPTSDFEFLLPDPKDLIQRLEDEENESTPSTQILPNTEDFDKIFPGLHLRSNRFDKADYVYETVRDQTSIVGDDQEAVPTLQSAFQDQEISACLSRNHVSTKKRQQTLEGEVSEPILPGAILPRSDIQTNIFAVPQRQETQKDYPTPEGEHVPSSHGNPDKRRDNLNDTQDDDNDDRLTSPQGECSEIFRNLSPLTESYMVSARKPQILQDENSHFVTPTNEVQSPRRYHAIGRDGKNKSPRITHMVPSRCLDSPIRGLRGTDTNSDANDTKERNALRDSDAVLKVRSYTKKHPFHDATHSSTIQVCHRTFEYLSALANGISLIDSCSESIWGDTQLLYDVGGLRRGQSPEKKWLRRATWWMSMSESPCDPRIKRGRRHLLQGYEGIVISEESFAELRVNNDTEETQQFDDNEGDCPSGLIHFRSLTSGQVSILVIAYWFSRQVPYDFVPCLYCNLVLRGR